MQKYLPWISVLLFIGAFYLNIIGLMNMFPRIISLSLLFFTIYLCVYSFMFRKTFKGFKKMKSR